MPEAIRYRKIALQAPRKDASGPSTADEETRSVEVVGATEQPVEVFDWDRGEVVREVLLMDGMQLPENRQLPILDSHMRWEADDVKGSYRDMRIEGGKLLGRATFDSSEEKLWGKIRDGHITDFSVGYRVLEEERLRKGQKQAINGREFEGPLSVATRWAPKELSVVPIGADDKAKARSDALGNSNRQSEENRKMSEENKAQGAQAPTPSPVIEIDEGRIRAEARKAEQERIREINAIAEGNADKYPEIRDAARRAVDDGTPLEKFREVFVELVTKQKPQPVGKNPNIGMGERELKDYRLTRAVMAMIDPRNYAEKAGLELEASRAVAEKLRREPQGFFIPADVLVDPSIPAQRGGGQVQTRGMVAGTGASGGYFVDTVLLAQSFLQILQNRMMVRRLGATVLDGLVGNIAIPKETTGATMYWLAEDGAPSESANALGQIGMTPKTAGAYRDISRQLMMQSSISVENYVRMSLATAIALGLDLAALHGTGLNNQPRGLAKTPGINDQNVAAADFAKIVKFLTSIATANADDGSMAWLGNPNVRGKLMVTDRGTGVGQFLWNIVGNGLMGEMIGFPAYASNQVTSQHLFFGDWSKIIIGMWGGLDVTVDPYTNSTTGAVRVVMFQSCDIQVTYPAGFSHSDDVTV